METDLREIRAKIHNLEKGELHVHLNGLVSTETIQTLVTEENIPLPPNFDLNRDLNRIKRCVSLENYLEPWRLLRLLPKTRKQLTLIVQDAFRNLKNDNVSFVEIRNSLLNIAKNINYTNTQTLEWLIEDLENCSEKMSIKVGLILTVTRSSNSKKDLQRLLKAYEEIGCPNIVKGLDLAGDENVEIDKSIGELFKYAKETHNLGITIHAGETGKIQNIIEAVDFFHADRIGHGTAAGKNFATMKMLKEKQICLEVCPISNLLTNAVKSTERHPINKFLEYDVPFIICSDNPGIHKKNLTDDYMAAYIETNNLEVLLNMFELQKLHSFIFNK
jgi:adenosine deaminase